MYSKAESDIAVQRKDPFGKYSEPAYSGVVSFLRSKYTKELDGVDVAVTGIPFDTAVTHRPGTRFGPRAIRTASSQIDWDSPYNWDFDVREKMSVVDYGDMLFDHGRLDEVPGLIEQHIAGILEKANGRVWNNRPGPAAASSPLEKTTGKITRPAISATTVSSIAMVSTVVPSEVLWGM